MITKDHAVAGVGALGVTDMLTNVLAGLLHQPPTLASSEAGLIVLGIGSLYGIGAALLRRRLPPPGTSPAVDAAPAALPVPVASATAAALLFAVLALASLSIVACTPQQMQNKVASFEQQAGPKIAAACAVFHQVEADPLVQLAVAGGTTAAGAANAGAGVIAGLTVASIKTFGDNFCAAGPPPGDTTTVAQQASWLDGVTTQLLTAASKAVVVKQ